MQAMKLIGLNKSFGPTTVLSDINLDINEGEFVVLIGASGSGKSTLLRMLCGLESISSGQLLVGGTPYNDVKPQDRNMAMVFQSYALYPHMNVYKNIAYGLNVRGETKQDIRTKIDKAAATLQMQPYLKRYPRELSGGQRQRVAMGRAIVRQPDFFLFDEPLSNLDAKLRLIMRKEIKLLQRTLGVTTLYVTHDQAEAMTLADKIVLLENGKIVQTGTPASIYDSPNCLYTASFMGSPSINLLSGTADLSTPATPRLKTEHGTLSLPLKPQNNATLSNGQPIILGIRPEDFYIAEKGFQVDVNIVEFVGSEYIVYGILDGHEVNILLPRDGKFQGTEKTITINYDVSRTHSFDKTTTRSLSI